MSGEKKYTFLVAVQVEMKDEPFDSDYIEYKNGKQYPNQTAIVNWLADHTYDLSKHSSEMPWFVDVKPVE